ncbi:cyclophilin-like fold protein [Flavitalea antarctica]
MAASFTHAPNIDSAKLKIIVGTNVFTATLSNNATVTAFTTRLPLTIQMKDLNGNEKFFDLPDNLPANASNPGTIQAGDLRLYGSNTLVLFYKTFSTSYPYTPMGRIDDASGLAAALGSADVRVTFALQ